MVSSIGGIVFALVMLWVAGERVMARFQRPGRGVASVRRDLAGRRSLEGEVHVVVWKAHPLSDHMIKELATSEGFKFVDESSLHGSRVLRFVPPRKGI
ncbi:hypothetical protein [Saccharopolyspora flava]|uniref:Uncharacterized protein n=1 Tax=Saccharopolyspora flava TaxID=95161 RepID=A0A1I6UZP4_9PSEU|nr:hypothetical protein [Saccharopolyspora flava]SFT06827.1 hypothetical protein SAMN05660874_05426 [Saccharopolyspora flava]